MNNYIKTKCRVVAKHHDLYKVKIESKIRDALLKGSFLYNIDKGSDYPTVGDWVTTMVYNDLVIIEEVVERSK
jgi:putative ribosome biogenesis GTPase RsgA